MTNFSQLNVLGELIRPAAGERAQGPKLNDLEFGEFIWSNYSTTWAPKR